MGRRLLFVDHAQALGGAEFSLLLLLEHLDRALWQPYLACPPGALADRATRLGVPVYRLSLPRLRQLKSVGALWQGGLALARLVRALDASMLIANTVRAAFYGALGAHLAGVPFIWYMRDFWLSEAKPRRLWLDAWGKRVLSIAAKRIIANSQATARHLPGAVTVIHNGIKVTRYDPSLRGEALRVRYGIPQEAPLLGMVGRLRPWKGQDRFLRVLAWVRERIDAWGLIVGGEPFAVSDGYSERLRHLAGTLGLSDRVVFTGQLRDVRTSLAAMDVFVHPGEPEPFGLVNIEAMAMAKPVVAFAHGALPEIVLPTTGVLVPPGDEKAMAEVLVNLLQDPARRQALGQAGRERALNYFSIERVASQVSNVLREVAGEDLKGG